MQPQFTGGVQVVILSCPAEHKGELWVECLQEIVAQGVKFCLGSSIWHLWGQGSLCISAEGTPAQGDQFNQEKAENNIQEPVSTSSLTVKSQRLEQEQMRSVFVWLHSWKVQPLLLPGHSFGTWQRFVSRRFGNFWEFVAAGYCFIESLST